MKKVSKLGVFLLLFVIQFIIITNVLAYKREAALSRCFYSYEKNSMDVVFFGTSKVYANINPCVLWQEYGISSFDFAGSSKPMWNTYYDIVETLKRQKPQLIVVDVYGVFGEGEYSSTEYAIEHVMGLQMSLNKWRDIKASVDEDKRMDFLFHYPIYHSRYNIVSEYDYRYCFGRTHPRYLPGTIMRYNTEPQTPEIDVGEIIEKTELAEKQYIYLCKIIEMCKSKDIDLLLINAPCCMNKEVQMKINSAWEIAEEYGVPYLDFNIMYEEVGINFEEDFSDSGHLNYKGSEKYTRWLGEYLSNQWKDKSSGFDGTMWEKSAEYYYATIADIEMAKVNNLSTYLTELSESDGAFVYMVSVRKGGCGEQLEKHLREAGVSEITILDGGTCVIDESECIFDSLGNDTFHQVIEMNNNYFEVKKDENSAEQLIYNGKNYKTNVDGVSIIVYDKITESFVNSVAFDAQDTNKRYMEE